MEIRVLKYFLTVVQEESITKAANILHITQPTLSRQLKNLEEELNTQLFIRGKTKISLTEDGLLLKRRAQEIVEMSNKVEKEISQRIEQVEGDISIGGGETPLMRYIGDVIKMFNKEYPLVKYNLHSGNADDIKEKIDNGLIDIGVLNEPVDIEKYDFVRIPKKDIWGILMLKSDPLASLPYVTGDDLKGKTLLSSNRLSVQKEISNWMRSSLENNDLLITYNLIYNASLMVEQGLGYAITLDGIINISEDSLICFKPFYPKLETGCVIVWKKNQIHSLAVQKFIEKIKSVV